MLYLELNRLKFHCSRQQMLDSMKPLRPVERIDTLRKVWNSDWPIRGFQWAANQTASILKLTKDSFFCTIVMFCDLNVIGTTKKGKKFAIWFFIIILPMTLWKSEKLFAQTPDVMPYQFLSNEQNYQKMVNPFSHQVQLPQGMVPRCPKFGSI